MKKQSYFEYNEGKGVVPEGSFRISASGVSNFYDRTSQWYREHFLGEDGFTGNTASNLGTVVHAGIEMYVNDGEVDWEAIEDFVNSLDHPDVDNNEILTSYATMIETAIPYLDNNMPDKVEEFIFHEILPGIGAGGSIDARYVAKRRLKDWKTTSAKTAPTRFSRGYWFQQMTYAWVLKQKGIDIDYLDLVFITKGEVGRISEKTNKPLKDYPSVLSVVTEEVTPEKLELVGSCLQLIAESVQTWIEKPELRHLLAQDNRLKAKPKPITFNKE